MTTATDPNREELKRYMELTVGAILEGKVKSITKFGAFITLPEGKSGLVHISEIAHSYVSEVREFLTEGQEVKVMVIGIDPAGKINLSIKRTQPRPQQNRAPQNNRAPQQSNRTGAAFRSPQPRPTARPTATRPTPDGELLAPTDDRSFEDKLKAFMSESDSKLAGCRQYEHKTKSRRR